MIAHGWSDISLNLQSKALAVAFSKNNKVIFLNAKKTGTDVLIINDNLAVYEWPGKRPVGRKDFWFAVKKIREYRPDIIITNFAANDIMLFVSSLLQVKTRVCYFHTLVRQHIADHQNLSLHQRINIFRKGIVFRMATHMLASSDAAREDLINFYQVKKKKIHIFPNALPDTDLRNNQPNNTIGFLGRLDRSKGVDILVEAFKKIINNFSDAKLIIVGKGLKEKELKDKIAAYELSDKVLFKGIIPYEDVRSFLISINFLVVPSRMDNLPTVALEAFSVATPVIGSNAGGIPNIIEDGYNGLLFENENADMLSQKMKWLLENKEERNLMSLNARKTFEEKFNIKDLPEKFEVMLEKIESLLNE